MRKLIIILVILSLTFLFACEKVIPLNIEYRNPRLVVNSMLMQDSLIKLDLSCSRIIIDNAEVKAVENATVKLFKDGNFVENLIETSPGIYQSTYRAESGNNYSFEIDAPDYEPITCETQVPFAQPIIAIDTSRGQGDYTEVLQFRLKFALDANQKQFFMLRMKSDYYTEEDEDEYNYYYQDYVSLNSNDVIVESNGYDSGLLFSDRLINTDTYTFTGSADSYFYDTVKLIFQFYYLDESMYQYLTTRNSHMDAQGNPLMEPVVVYSNVSSGMGILGSASLVTDTIVYYPNLNNNYY
jgi:hypothetical protein